jgi:hypothetical protein
LRAFGSPLDAVAITVSKYHRTPPTESLVSAAAPHQVSLVAVGASILTYITVIAAILATANLRRLLENHMKEEESVAWSSADVLSQTIHKLNNLGLRHEHLSEWYDIDTANDLERLQ